MVTALSTGEVQLIRQRALFNGAVTRAQVVALTNEVLAHRLHATCPHTETRRTGTWRCVAEPHPANPDAHYMTRSTS